MVVLDGSHLVERKEWHALADVIFLTGAAQRPRAVLLDVRGSAFTPTAAETEMLASALAGCPWAAIVSDGGVSYGCARMVATWAELRGSGAAAFVEETAAQGWLAERLSEQEPPA